MKRVLLLTAFTISVTIASGQKSIDDLFERYAGKNGFTTVTIDGNLLKLAGCFKNEQNDDPFPADVTEIRILAQDQDDEKVENFYNLVIRDIDLDNYDEFMSVKNSNQNMKMLVRTDGNKLKEFLLIAGGEDNAIIQIKGSMTIAEARKFSGEITKNNGLKGITNDSK